MNASTAGSGGPIVVAGVGYAGLHVALRLTARLRSKPVVKLTLVDRHDYHQVITELPRVAAPADAGSPGHLAAGDLASVTDPRTGHVLPPLEEGETVARNLDAELKGRPLEAFTFHDKGFIVSVGTRRAVADITTGGRAAHLLKDAIKWEYRQSVRHLRGWDPVAR